MISSKLTNYQSYQITAATTWDKAKEAGDKAVQDCVPVPMIVQQHKNMMDDDSPVKKEWFVEDGVCGFAWVNIKPGNSPFAKWLKENGIAQKDSYYGGITIWVTVGDQSYQKKMVWAEAVVEVLQNSGIKAYASGRLD